jgi:glycosyltransferase involved in cell wall biosynthesis
MAGLFVQKHAEAVALFCDVKVLYVHDDENIKTFEIVEKKQPNFTEFTVYYPCKKGTFFYKLKKTFNYAKAYWIGYKQITADGFLPDIVHANILTRTGFIAYLHKCWKGIPYIVTEHWSRYLTIRNAYKGVTRKLITQLVVKNASVLLPVSECLQKAMMDCNLQNVNYKVVNNVVDDYFFKEIPIVHRKIKRILHVSCFDERAKNISGLLRATSALSKVRADFELIIIGTGIDFDYIKNYAKTLDFQNGVIHFLGEKTPEEVANWMQNSDFFVLFSNYENSPVVISESLACGKPVLSSNVGGISEHVKPSNGILVEAGDEISLSAKMSFLLDHYHDYDTEKIKAEANQKFSYKVVGENLTEIYKQAIK